MYYVMKTLKASFIKYHTGSKKSEIPLPLLFTECWVKVVREVAGWDGERGRKRWWGTGHKWQACETDSPIDFCREPHSAGKNGNPLHQVHSGQIPLKSS